MVSAIAATIILEMSFIACSLASSCANVNEFLWTQL